ncbi:phosphate ABC transporter membrane protein 1 (PhoT family) [Actinocorallia herbida]|uniref:Phosphate transport system permease protein n=1 Tax=Actinocorallia herbida TaxID=58109 RepID=A0A3N1CQ00_9ACTN|nr:phosphate ABC transporter permease subunit PstC [Actinocorallia herbida]ROO83391.1 phosphate ABC transporter membrane protein 1 (PhoT family) [Actinocorallia herbida]
MSIASPAPPHAEPVAEQKRRTTARLLPVDVAFRTAVRGSGLTLLVILGFIGLFLALRGFSALDTAGHRFFTTQTWDPELHDFGIASVLPGTVEIALTALVVGVPIAVFAALYISEYAAPGMRRALIALIDLMAAIPSILYGLWGVTFLQPRLIGVSRWLSDHASFLPFFRVDTDHADPGSFTSSHFIAGLVVGMMVIPICCSLSREVFSQAPQAEREAAYALGSTRWGMIRTVVLPFGRGGVIGAAMLSLGRALGETIAVVLIISPDFRATLHVLEGAGNSISALIALRYSDSSEFGLSALMAAGLVLFAVTLVINFFAAMIINRSRSGASTEA